MTSADVMLVTMPHAQIMRPSIALGILKSCLVRERISCGVEYANIRFAEQIGLETTGLLMQLRSDSLIGEWIFAGAAFGDPAGDRLQELLGSAGRHQPKTIPPTSVDDRRFEELFRRLRAFAPSFIAETARRVLTRGPRIIGCTSTFEQHCPSLALLRAVKRLDPSAISLLGGANCEGNMGWATLKNAPWVDYVFSGEAEESLPALCRSILDGRPPSIEKLPGGVLSQAHIALGKQSVFPAGKIPRAVVRDLNTSPIPDFEEYFSALASSPLRPFVSPALAVESSRGCWWGQKSHCTFCGLNGDGMSYRSKSPERVLEEWEELARRHAVKKMLVVDNIIDMGHVRELLPELAKSKMRYELFYETKANLRREQTRLFAQAGVTYFQPGIEALHDDLLHLMGKGNSVAINVQVLKYARESGISSAWMLLVGFPGEENSWHASVAGWLPLLFHLQPANGVVHIRYDRFSMYFQEPEKYGLDLQPYPGYACIFPFSDEDLRDIAYFFHDANQPGAAEASPEIQALGEQVRQWKMVFQRPVPPVLTVADNGDHLDFFDTRPCAPRRRSSLTGRARDVYLCCDTSITRPGLLKRFCTGPDAALSETALDAILSDLVSRTLVLDLHGQFVGLACFGDVPAFPAPEEHPHGFLARFDPQSAGSLRDAWSRLETDPPHFPKEYENEIRPT